MDRESFLTEFRGELRRIGLDPDEIQALAVHGDPARWLAQLRALPVGSAWTDVFPGEPEGWTPSTPEPECALGPFDYQAPPFGRAVFASLGPGAPVAALDAAIERARTLGYPIYGAGVILDRGHPHLYIVLPLGASEEDADEIADALRDRNGIGNAYPIDRGRHTGDA
jgi:hypothetical protein